MELVEFQHPEFRNFCFHYFWWHHSRMLIASSRWLAVLSRLLLFRVQVFYDQLGTWADQWLEVCDLLEDSSWAAILGIVELFGSCRKNRKWMDSCRDSWGIFGGESTKLENRIHLVVSATFHLQAYLQARLLVFDHFERMLHQIELAHWLTLLEQLQARRIFFQRVVRSRKPKT